MDRPLDPEFTNDSQVMGKELDSTSLGRSFSQYFFEQLEDEQFSLRKDFNQLCRRLIELVQTDFKTGSYESAEIRQAGDGLYPDPGHYFRCDLNAKAELEDRVLLRRVNMYFNKTTSVRLGSIEARFSSGYSITSFPGMYGDSKLSGKELLLYGGEIDLSKNRIYKSIVEPLGMLVYDSAKTQIQEFEKVRKRDFAVLEQQWAEYESPQEDPFAAILQDLSMKNSRRFTRSNYGIDNVKSYLRDTRRYDHLPTDLRTKIEELLKTRKLDEATLYGIFGKPFKQ